MEQEIINRILGRVLARLKNGASSKTNLQPITIGVSNRHLHLALSDLEILFGKGYELKPERELTQPGQYAARETVLLAGPRGCLERVRVLGPVRKQTQVEISRNDSFKLGLNPPVRESGDLAGSEAVTVIGPKGSVVLKEGLIIACRHIHMSPADAENFGVTDGAGVMVKTGGNRSVIFDQVVIRVSSKFSLELHLDTDEANAAGVNNGDPSYLLVLNGETNYSDNGGIHKRPEDFSKTPGEAMSLVTEEAVRKAWKNKSRLYVRQGAIYTPLARDTITDLRVEVILR